MKRLQNIRDVFKTIKHRKPSAFYCPRCCSPKINLHSGLDIWLTPRNYVCETCGYVGPVVLELEPEENPEVLGPVADVTVQEIEKEQKQEIENKVKEDKETKEGN